MKDRLLTVISNIAVADNIYRMVMQSDDFEPIRGGQFVHVQLPDKTHILRRPFCIADYNAADKAITIVYAVVGEGTRILSAVKAGERINALFPLGNGFLLNEFKGKEIKKAILIAGGMGSAVMPAVPNSMISTDFYTFLGFANANKAVLIEELRAKSKEIHIATDDGSLGYHGFVTDLMRSRLDEIKPDVILACGPEIMYKSLKHVTEGCGVPIYVSLEQRMGCGIGACLVCNCKIKTAEGDKYKRVCVDGPVFNLNEVVL